MEHDTLRRTVTSTGDPAWLASGYSRVRQLLADPRLDLYHDDPPSAPKCFDSGVFSAPKQSSPTVTEEHQRMRRLVGRSMSARRLAALRPATRSGVDELLDELASCARPADFHRTVSYPLPTLVLCELFGVPGHERAEFRGWLNEAIRVDDETSATNAVVQLSRYVGSLIEQRSHRPGTDVPSDLGVALAEDPENWTVEALTRVACGVLLAGVGPTIDAIDDGVVLLLTNPDQWTAVRQDPGSVDTAVEELLRLSATTGPPGDPTPVGIPRWANADIQLDDIRIEKGELVLLDFHAANRDEQHVESPDEVNVRRTKNLHLMFGGGPHFCLGAPLARMELQVLFGALVERFPELRLAMPREKITPRDPRFAAGATELLVEW